MTSFNFTYFISIFITSIVVFVLHNKYDKTLPNYLLYFIIPLTVSYIVLFILNNIFTTTSQNSNNIGNYLEDRVLNTLDNTKNYTLYPIVGIAIFIFFITLYLQLLN